MIYKKLKQTYNFSLLTKTPKAIKPPQQSTSWFGKLFRKNQNSVTYVLLQQLFTYLETTNLIQKQFPYLKNLQKFQQNSMILHVHLLRERIKQETQLPRSQLQKYQYNLQTVFFPNYSSFVNKAIPTQNFRQHYAQAYLKKLQLYSQFINELEWAINPNKQSINSQQYSLLFKKLIYENRVQVGNIQLLKFCKYYLAHKKYLSMLEWNDMVHYRVKWGLESLRYIGEVEEISKNNKNNKKS